MPRTRLAFIEVCAVAAHAFVSRRTGAHSKTRGRGVAMRSYLDTRRNPIHSWNSFALVPGLLRALATVSASAPSAPRSYPTVHLAVPVLREDTGPFTRPFSCTPEPPPRGPKFCHTREAPRRGTHALPPSPIHLRRPATSRLWASTAARTQRILTASCLEMWLRRFALHHLHCSCRSAAQLLRMGAAFGAMPHLSAVEPDRAGPTPATLPGCCLDFIAL